MKWSIPGSAVGSLDTVRVRIREFADLGVTELLVARHGLPGTAEEIAALLDELRV